MFQRFLKARSVVNFKVRSASRDTETDRTRVNSIFRSIEEALEGAKAEHAGLKARIDDSVARSAVTLGNGSDEYLTRDPVDDHYQNLLGTEMAEGQRRLTELEVTMTHIQFLKKNSSQGSPVSTSGMAIQMQMSAGRHRLTRAMRKDPGVLRLIGWEGSNSMC